MKKIVIPIVIVIIVGVSTIFVLGRAKTSTSLMSTSIVTQRPTNDITNSSTPLSTSAPKSLVLTLAQVSQHNSPSDCYLIIKNTVYDVSSYINKHPGGSAAITSSCGTEVTGIFASIHSNSAWNLLKNYQIGTI